MNRSTFCETSMLVGLCFFSKFGYMIGIGFKILTPHPYKICPESPRPTPTHKHNYRGHERVYKFKEENMNRSTFCEIKYMNRLGFFSKAGYMIGAGFKILTRTSVQKLPPPPPPRVYSDEAHPDACATLETGAMSI